MKERELKNLISRQLIRRLGELPKFATAQLEQLSIEKLELLSEELLDLETLADLNAWLARNTNA